MMPNTRLQKLLDFLSQEPEDPFLKYALATEYLAQQDTEKALQYFENLVEQHADYVGTYYHLGKLYEQLARKEEALLLYKKGIQVAQSQGNAHARAELQSVYQLAMGLDYEDD